MRAVERLQRDHGVLRAKLGVLETALQMGPEAWYVLREVCFTLSRQLRDHIRREEELIAACREGMTPTALAEVSLEHEDEPRQLRTINRLFITETGHSLERIQPVLQGVIEKLRHHMAEEERELFPLLERTLAAHESVGAPSGPAQRFEEAMTVNRVVQQFPRTRTVFERLFIDVPMEGCTCLDEVAWRHGMEAGELLRLLDDAVESCACGAKPPVAAEAVPAAAVVTEPVASGRDAG